MGKYDIFYENIGGEKEYLDNLQELLDGDQNISFSIQGLIVDLHPGMTKEDILNAINSKREEAENNAKPVEMQEGESLLAFSKRIAGMSKSYKSYFSSTYKSQKIIACPESTDFDMLYQMMQINSKILSNDENVEDFSAIPGEDYMSFGQRIFQELKNGKNIIGHFNFITMPFTSDLANLDSFVYSDAFTFSSMIYNMLYVRDRQNEAFDNAREEKQKNTDNSKISPADALKSALASGVTLEDTNRSSKAENTNEKDTQNHDGHDEQ